MNQPKPSSAGTVTTYEAAHTRQTEDAKYSRLYQQGYGVGPVHTLYEVGCVWGAFIGVQSAVDIGCGSGAGMVLLEQSGIKRVVGVDIAGYVVKQVQGLGFEAHNADCRQLASLFGKREFDLLWSCDMLEHLPPEWVHPALEAMHHICAKTALFNISTRSSLTRDDDGGDLHLTVQPDSWWRQMLDQAGFAEQRSEVRRDELRIMAGRA